MVGGQHVSLRRRRASHRDKDEIHANRQTRRWAERETEEGDANSAFSCRQYKLTAQRAVGLSTTSRGVAAHVPHLKMEIKNRDRGTDDCRGGSGTWNDGSGQYNDDDHRENRDRLQRLQPANPRLRINRPFSTLYSGSRGSVVGVVGGVRQSRVAEGEAVGVGAIALSKRGTPHPPDYTDYMDGRRLEEVLW